MNNNQPLTADETPLLTDPDDNHDLTSPTIPQTPATPSAPRFDLTLPPANSPESTAVSPQDDMAFDQHIISQTEKKRPSILLTADGSQTSGPNKQRNAESVEDTGYIPQAQMAEEKNTKEAKQQQKKTTESKTKRRRLSSLFREAGPEHRQNTEPKKTRCAIS